MSLARCQDAEPGAQGTAAERGLPGGRQPEIDAHPVASRWHALVDQHPHRPAIVHDHQVRVAVVVQVASGDAATDLGYSRSFEVRDLFEAAAAEAAKEEVGLPQRERIAGPELLLDPLDGAVGDVDVEFAVEVVVHRGGAEAGVDEARPAEAAAAGAVVPEPVALVDIERVRLVLEMGHEQIDQTVAVEVLGEHPHARLRLSGGIDRRAGEDRVVDEC